MKGQFDGGVGGGMKIRVQEDIVISISHLWAKDFGYLHKLICYEGENITCFLYFEELRIQLMEMASKIPHWFGEVQLE